ncbi:MAG: hypothetical protein JSU92_12115 [Deltaproteobacteria bacterium]|nr:MAG: hypothetical protein JSU92_12115 [Deltaproteobacteria bacterium]
MKKKLIFSLAVASIVTVGLLSWSCDCDDDDGNGNGVINVEVTAAPGVSSGGTVIVTARVTAEDSTVQVGKEVSFEITTKPTGSAAAVDPATGTTDADGKAIGELSAGTVTGTIVLQATVEGESDSATIIVCRVYVEDLYDEPAFRLVLEFESEILELLCVLCEFPPIETKIIFTIIGLETIDGTHDVVGTMVNGLCGAPAGPATTSCTGTITDFYIDPAFYDEDGCVENYFPGTVTDGYFYSDVPEITLTTDFGGEIMSFSLFDLVIEGDVNGTMTIFSGMMSGAIKESDLVSESILAFASMGGADDVPGVDCAGARAFLGIPDVDIDGSGIPDCEDTPLIQWCWCEKDAEVLCASEQPLSDECVAQCTAEDGTQECKETAQDYIDGGKDPMYIGSEDGYSTLVLFEANKMNLFHLPE